MLHIRPYSLMLNCDKWGATSELVFPSSRTDSRAVQAVRVHKAAQQETFTFCLQRIDQGPYKVGFSVYDGFWCNACQWMAWHQSAWLECTWLMHLLHQIR